jgi:tetratricopeptide (TPR) repeat protein
MFARDDETAALLRQATAFADAKNWDEATAALRSANQRMKTSPVSYPIETWLKLPLYLQRAGQFDESVRMFDQIDAETPARVERFLGHESAQVRKQSTTKQRKVIAQKKALAARRESARSGQ